MKEYEIEIHVTTREKVRIKADAEVQAVCSAEVSIAEMLYQDQKSGKNKYVGAEVQIPEWEQE